MSFPLIVNLSVLFKLNCNGEQNEKLLQQFLQAMFFPEDEPEIIPTDPEKIIYIYDNGDVEGKPIEFKFAKRKDAFREIKKCLDYSNLRLFNSEGAEYFQDDLQFVKNKSVLYASNGENFDPASTFGEYEMHKKLGEGGFGQVWLAENRQNGERFAIKIIKTQRAGSASDIDGIFVEAETLKSLKHENIVKVHQLLTLKDMKLAIIMEYLEGGELLQYVQERKRLDEETARIIVKQIVKAMTYCHSNGLIHRDLKLQNLLLVNKEELRIKVIDFGIAGVMKSMEWEDLDLGSLGYMAPQCFINNKGYKVDGRIDVWSVGVILYAMLAGQLPFKGETRQEAIEAIKKAKFKLNPVVKSKLSEDCLDVLDQCLRLDPRDRITMEDLQSHSWISGELFQAHQYQEKETMDLSEDREQDLTVK